MNPSNNDLEDQFFDELVSPPAQTALLAPPQQEESVEDEFFNSLGPRLTSKEQEQAMISGEEPSMWRIHPSIHKNVKGLLAGAKGLVGSIPIAKYSGILPALLAHMETPEGFESAEKAGGFFGEGAKVALSFHPAAKVTSFLGSSAPVKYATAALAGAIYKTIDKLGEGKMPTEQEIRNEVGTFVAMEGVFGLIGKGVKALINKGVKPPDITPELLTDIMTSEAPTTVSETANKALEVLKAEQKSFQAAQAPHVPPPAPAPEVTTAKFPQSTERPGKSVELNMPKKAPSLEGRAKPEAHKNLGLKVELPHANPTPEQRALNPFKERVENLTQSGKAAKAIVEKEDKALYKTANEKFEISKKLNKAAKEEKPDLVKELTKIRKDISKIPEPSPVQKRLQNSIDTFVDSIVKKNKNGEIVGFKKVANQTMIEQMQSWKQIVDYEFAHGDPANIYKLAIGALENSIEKSMVGKEAVAAWKEAKATYKEWAQTFNNDYVNPFRSATNKDYAKNFEKLTKDFDYFNQVAPVLERDAAGKQLIDSARREIVENTFGKFFKDPTSMTRKEALKELKELEAVLTPQQVKSVEEGINEALAKEPITFKATYEPVVKDQKNEKSLRKA